MSVETKHEIIRLLSEMLKECEGWRQDVTTVNQHKSISNLRNKIATTRQEIQNENI